jgi:hypothetical protein
MKTQTFILGLMMLVTSSVLLAQTNSKHSIVGTWNQLSSEYTLFDGTKGSHTKETTTRVDLFNATHWMRIAHRDGKFENAVGGTYISQNNKLKLTVLYSSDPGGIGRSFELVYRIEGNKLYCDGTSTNSSGQTMTWHDIYEKAEGVATAK